MPLPAGTKLGPYEILAPIGAGGMGEVYRARDSKLDRDVAIKVLPQTLAQDPERLARFEREAKVLAALNHPNIAQIYGLEQRALVMELVEGETLKGPLPVETALNYAKQTADALEAAHEKGITHRDLKPANIMVTPAGVVKVLDFGLAAVAQDPASGSTDPSNSPTLTMRATQTGMILGTAAYMSPEQAAGKPVDRRADIWSFGVVLFELLTGRQLFGEGETISHTLADVLRAPIDFDKLPKETPRAIRDLLQRCLDRDVRNRLRDIGEARVAIQRYLASPIGEPEAQKAVPARARLHPWVIAGISAVCALTLAFLHFRETPPPERTLRYTVAAPENSAVHSFAISPDGRFISVAEVVNGKRQLWLRPLDALQAQPMPGTEDATYPFWSPDSRYIGFFAEGKLKKIAASGGPAQSLCNATDGRGGSWNRDGVIVFSPAPNNAAIQRVSAAGGVPSDVTKTKSTSRFPTFLPDGRHFLYLKGALGITERDGLYISSLDGRENRLVLADRSSAVFAPSVPGSRIGHLLFVRENTLMAQPFDAGSAQTSGDVFPLADAIGNLVGFAPVAVSENGVLLYGNAGGNLSLGFNQIAWYDRAGKLLGPVGAPGNVLAPAISPDEKLIAFTSVRTGAGTAADIWLRDLARGVDIRFTSDAYLNYAPIWSPKGESIVFSSLRAGETHLVEKAASASGQEKVLFPVRGTDQWSRDGQFIVYQQFDPRTKQDVWVLPTVAGAPSDRKPIPFLHTEFNELHGQLSPDSRWMAYTSDESGQREVYVRPFPASDGLWRISTAGGHMPRWRGDGKELFFAGADGKMMAVEVRAATSSNGAAKVSFEASAPVPLFEAHLIGTPVTNTVFQYDVTADGKRFLVVTNNLAAATPSLTVVVNWNAGLKK